MDTHFNVVGMIAEFIRILLTLTRPFSDKILSFFYHLVMGPTKPLPPITNPLLLCSATELAEKIRKKQVKCEDVMKAYVERSKEVHPVINAACDERYEDALEDARAVDRFLNSSNKSVDEIEKDTPLLGVPFTCKEAIGVKGMVQTCGIVLAKDHIAEEDSAVAALYRKAGAIPVTVTNVPEICMWWESANLIFGMVKNPYDSARTVGGSSGGEGAIITSGAAVIGIGNDVAGSIRIPASFCGIYGHKPSKMLISNYGSFPCEPEVEDEVTDFICTGPMCRYVQDLPLTTRILSGNDKRIPWDSKVNFCDIKLYYLEDIPGLLNKSMPVMKERMKMALKHFETCYSVKPIKLQMKELKYAFPIWERKLLERGCPSFKGYLAGESGKVNLWWEFAKSCFRQCKHTLPVLYCAMVERRNKDNFYYRCLKAYQGIERKFQEIFEEDAILLLPTHPEPPPHYLMTIPKYPNIAYTCIFNILGYPGSQIPTGMYDGVPVGIQAISGHYKDHLTLATALELDKVFGGWKSPCSINTSEDPTKNGK
ncbi:fatty-acid amide hydrolase 2 isoform X2 [Parasteatoda tepidariorum]|uniref:fatty-acid amide hydrolase 2 isoform X2 n=1 Tax=Parasteatoda tepidariorum TaxID=114398 RepID=UPI001C7270A6|nr:fatty-acid amide hydrolase 2 isoform X2 [Parasteatoda tepidariorum]